MPSKRNPLNLNPLQLRTLALLQALTRIPGNARQAGDDGALMVGNLPPMRGDHFHLGDAVVMSRDASGLHNPAVWVVLERKGLIKSHFPDAATVTPAGLAYETGVESAILHRADHAAH